MWIPPGRDVAIIFQRLRNLLESRVGAICKQCSGEGVPLLRHSFRNLVFASFQPFLNPFIETVRHRIMGAHPVVGERKVCHAIYTKMPLSCSERPSAAKTQSRHEKVRQSRGGILQGIDSFHSFVRCQWRGCHCLRVDLLKPFAASCSSLPPVVGPSHSCGHGRPQVSGTNNLFYSRYCSTWNNYRPK